MENDLTYCHTLCLITNAHFPPTIKNIGISGLMGHSCIYIAPIITIDNGSNIDITETIAHPTTTN